MRLLFLVSDDCWSARARVFVLAARGLAARGHEALIACESSCPVQARAAEAGVPVLALDRGASGTSVFQLRREFNERQMDVVFVHTDAEHMVASSAARLGAGAAAIVRRIPPFASAEPTRTARFAARVSPTGLLFSTDADRRGASSAGHRIASGVAPLAIDVAQHETVRAHARAALGVPPNACLIVCVNDGADRSRGFTALRVLSLLAPRHPELHLAVVGAGVTDELRMHGAALGVNAVVTYVGARDDELAILRAADVGWIAAESDACALAAMDFMAFRIPVVAERAPVTEYFVADGVTGVLLPSAEPPTAAAAVASFLAKQEQRVAMGNAGRSRLDRDFPYDAMIQGFETMARTAAARQPQPVG